MRWMRGGVCERYRQSREELLLARTVSIEGSSGKSLTSASLVVSVAVTGSTRGLLFARAIRIRVASFDEIDDRDVSHSIGLGVIDAFEEPIEPRVASTWLLLDGG